MHRGRIPDIPPRQSCLGSSCCAVSKFSALPPLSFSLANLTFLLARADPRIGLVRKQERWFLAKSHTVVSSIVECMALCVHCGSTSQWTATSFMTYFDGFTIRLLSSGLRLAAALLLQSTGLAISHRQPGDSDTEEDGHALAA